MNSLPVLNLSDHIEELAWDCRTGKTPKDLEHEGMDMRFGYVCNEYWVPDVINHTIKLDVCPYWVNKEMMLSRMDEVWDWADTETRLMNSIISYQIDLMLGRSADPVEISIPQSWHNWLGSPCAIFGTRCIGTQNYELFLVSSDDIGIFRRFDLYSLCDHDMVSTGNGYVSYCSKCRYRVVDREGFKRYRAEKDIH